MKTIHNHNKRRKGGRGSTSARSRDGFTLVELLVAASIILSALGAPLYVGVQGIILATEAKSRITATYLAEEAIELVRNQRDTNVLCLLDATCTTINDWQYKLDVCKSEDGCIVGRLLDPLSEFVNPEITFRVCGADGCDPVQSRGADDRKYGYYPVGSTEGRTIFTRTVNITEIAQNEIRVKVIVEWESRGNTNKIEISEHLFGYNLSNP